MSIWKKIGNAIGKIFKKSKNEIAQQSPANVLTPEQQTIFLSLRNKGEKNNVFGKLSTSQMEYLKSLENGQPVDIDKLINDDKPLINIPKILGLDGLFKDGVKVNVNHESTLFDSEKKPNFLLIGGLILGAILIFKKTKQPSYNYK